MKMIKARTFGIDRNARHALRWQGGKSPLSPSGTGRWVASKLPVDDVMTYVEPYAGMLGVLLQRPAVQVEIANDLNHRVVNWWTMVRDRLDDFKRALRYTPDSEEQFNYYMQTLDEGTNIERAVKFHVVTLHSLFASDSPENGGYGVAWTQGLGTRAHLRGGGGANLMRLIDRVADRIRHVQLLCRPAVEVIRRTNQNTDTLVYIDPPYPDTHSTYSFAELDVEELTDALEGHRGMVAISGYGDIWDHLGYRRNVYKTFTHNGQVASGEGAAGRREEVLWTNFDPPTQGEFKWQQTSR